MGLPSIAAYDLPRRDELPPARLEWRLEPKRAALLVHDLQRYFVSAFPPEATPVAPMLENVRALRDACDRAGVPVFYTLQRGDQDPRDRGLQADYWGPGMRAGAEHESVPEIVAPRASDLVLTKLRYSAFQRSPLEAMLRARGRDQLIVVGVYAHIGCTLTAAEAFMRDIQPFLVADAVADFSRDHHDRAVSYVAGCCGMALSTAAVLDALGGDR